MLKSMKAKVAKMTKGKASKEAEKVGAEVCEQAMKKIQAVMLGDQEFSLSVPKECIHGQILQLYLALSSSGTIGASEYEGQGKGPCLVVHKGQWKEGASKAPPVHGNELNGPNTSGDTLLFDRPIPAMLFLEHYTGYKLSPPLKDMKLTADYILHTNYVSELAHVAHHFWDGESEFDEGVMLSKLTHRLQQWDKHITEYNVEEGKKKCYIMATEKPTMLDAFLIPLLNKINETTSLLEDMPQLSGYLQSMLKCPLISGIVSKSGAQADIVSPPSVAIASCKSELAAASGSSVPEAVPCASGSCEGEESRESGQ